MGMTEQQKQEQDAKQAAKQAEQDAVETKATDETDKAVADADLESIPVAEPERHLVVENGQGRQAAVEASEQNDSGFKIPAVMGVVATLVVVVLLLLLVL